MQTCDTMPVLKPRLTATPVPRVFVIRACGRRGAALHLYGGLLAWARCNAFRCCGNAC